MRLKAFRVQKYKTIRDTGWVQVRTDVTTLVGMNESGKSSVMQALWKFNNVAGATYDLLYDYPRDLYSRERESGKTHEVVSLEFTLEDADLEAFSTDVGGTPPSKIVIGSTYGGKKSCSMVLPPEAEHCAKLSALKAAIAALGPEHAEKGGAAIEALCSVEKVLSAAVDAATVQAEVSAARNALSDVVPLVESDGPSAVESLTSVGARFTRVNDWILKRLPAFIYFEEYGTLQTKIHLPTFVAKKQQKSPEALIRTQIALFEWANLAAEEIQRLGLPKQGDEALDAVQRRKEERATLLESASYHLTGDWIEWWDQRHHAIKIDADGEDLVLKVSDEKNPWKVPFQERSKGFQWFFSFYLTFLVESRKAHNGAILLLDEPGLHLHIRAQQKLLSFFQRISAGNQIFYSTHSPFMVDPEHLDSVRTVYLSEDTHSKRAHTKVSHGTEPEGDRDTLLPLQAAFGYELAQTLFIGRRVLIVEGITDYWLLKTLSALLVADGRQGLRDEVVVLFAGGTSHVVPLVSLFARPGSNDQRLFVLLDADKSGLSKAGQLRREMLFGAKHVGVMADPDMLGIADAEVEDILDPSDAIAAFESFKGVKATPPSPPAHTNMALFRQLYATAGLGDFNHAEKAGLILHLVDTWRAGGHPHPTTLSRAATVIAGLNARLG